MEASCREPAERAVTVTFHSSPPSPGSARHQSVSGYYSILTVEINLYFLARIQRKREGGPKDTLKSATPFPYGSHAVCLSVP